MITQQYEKNDQNKDMAHVLQGPTHTRVGELAASLFHPPPWGRGFVYIDTLGGSSASSTTNDKTYVQVSTYGKTIV